MKREEDQNGTATGIMADRSEADEDMTGYEVASRA
jgi:hypothetical protein